MIEIVEKVGALFLTFLITMNLASLFMLTEAARTYLRDKNLREEAEARAKLFRESPVRRAAQ